MSVFLNLLPKTNWITGTHFVFCENIQLNEILSMRYDILLSQSPHGRICCLQRWVVSNYISSDTVTCIISCQKHMPLTTWVLSFKKLYLLSLGWNVWLLHPRWQIWLHYKCSDKYTQLMFMVKLFIMLYCTQAYFNPPWHIQ